MLNITKETLVLILVIGVVTTAVMGILSGNLLETATIDTRNLQIISAEVTGDSAGNYILSFTVKNFNRHPVQQIDTSYSTTTLDEIGTDENLRQTPSRWSGGSLVKMYSGDSLETGQSMSKNHSLGNLDLDDDITLILTVKGFLLDGTKLIHRVPVDIRV